MQRDDIVAGDSLEVQAQLPDECLELILTDPPFASGARRESDKTLRGAMSRGDKADQNWFEGDNLTTIGLAMMIHLNAVQWTRLLKPGCHALVFTDWRMYPTVCAALETGGLRLCGCIIWDKVHFGMGYQFRNQHEFIVLASKGKPRPPARRDVGNVISIPREQAENHPTEKPVGLLEILISALTAKGEIVGDFFVGSGSTVVAAIRLGRHFYACDINPDYVQIARQRAAAAKAQPFLFEVESLTNGRV